MIGARSIYYLLGVLLTILAAAMLIPLSVEKFIYQTQHWQIFALSSFLCGTIGSFIALANHSSDPIELRVREAFLLTAISWIVTTLFASLPFYWSAYFGSFIDAWFEAVSALTTTGSTVMIDLDQAPHGLLLWRSILQWLGGTGIIVMAMTVLPVLRIGGMQLFRSEFSDRSEKILPRVSQIGAAILSIYVLFTLLCAVCLYMAGMTPFDAICHSMSTVSTGGLSTHDQSISYFDNWIIELIIVFFMIIGGTTFVLFIKTWQGNKKALIYDNQFQAYLILLAVTTIVLSVWNWQINTTPFLNSLRESFFCVVSIVSSTGFTTTDYTHWGSFPILLIFLLTLTGGCTGSTSGGVKIFRFQIMFLVAHAHLRQLHRPHGVYLPTYQGQKIPETVAASVFTFITLYCFSGFCLASALSISGLDFVSSLSASIAALGNTGPGITELIGPAGNYQFLGITQKLLLMSGMILGRLELLTIFVIFMPSFWKS